MLDDGGLGSVLIAKNFTKMLYFEKGEADTRTRVYLKKIALLLINWLSNGLISTVNSWPSNLFVIYNSRSSKRYAEMNSVPTRNAGLIYSGIDLSKFVFKPRPNLSEPIQIIVPGRICKEKGTIDAVKLMSLLRDLKIQANLIIIGKVDSTDYYMEICNEIKNNNLNDIVFLDMVDQDRLTSLYLQSDICFFPSYQKYGLSRTPLEAMACGCILITYGNEGSHEIVQHCKTGFSVPEGDVDIAAKTIKERILQSNNIHSMVLQARSVIENHYSLDQYIHQFEKYLLSKVPQAIKMDIKK
ncbi:MAG: glycosyltransferase family 4 protein [Anaerolineales bacterium]|nr:glycosyltransferase family 4 protein [Anaerolineales bacterium]